MLFVDKFMSHFLKPWFIIKDKALVHWQGRNMLDWWSKHHNRRDHQLKTSDNLTLMSTSLLVLLLFFSTLIAKKCDIGYPISSFAGANFLSLSPLFAFTFFSHSLFTNRFFFIHCYKTDHTQFTSELHYFKLKRI